MKKSVAIWKSILWALLILLFPVGSGILSVVLSLNTRQTLFLQGGFMLAALVPPLMLVLLGKWQRQDVGVGSKMQVGLWLAPVLLIFIPAAVKGFVWPETAWGCLFLYAAVGLSEEVYFRGIIPGILKRAFSARQILWVSALIFGLGHAAGALSGTGLTETLLTIANAIVFGWMAMELVMLSESILPAVLTHFFFDFETKISALDAAQLLTAELVRGGLMFLAAAYLWRIIKKKIP